MSAATLSAHAGGYKCSEDAVRAIKAPEATKTWHPIPHGDLLDMVLEKMSGRGLKVETKEFALANDGAQMFSVFNLSQQGNKDFTLALGLRNSIDKTLPAGLCAGSRVFVCDNLAFSAQVVLGRKHTTNILRDLPQLVDGALNDLKVFYGDQDVLFQKWKEHTITVERASDVIMRMAEAKNIPSHNMLDVRKEFITPRFKEFDGQTVWGLYNAATTVMRHDRKEINPVRATDQLLGIHETLKREFALAN